MAPDLNSVPPSPRPRDSTISAGPSQPLAPSRSRRASSTMAPPPLPSNPVSPTTSRTMTNLISDNSGVGTGPGPLRHPRPMTPAELHLELEKEQEGIVNRLTRELSFLRQQTASVASTASSTSELLADYPVIIPTSARRHRSSSNLSTRSARSINAATTNATSVSGVAPARETSVPTSSRPSVDLSRPELSRQNSVVGRRSITSSPSLSSAPIGYSNPFPPSNYPQAHRQSSASLSGGPNSAVDSYTYHHVRSPSFSAAVAAARYEEAAFHRAELDAVKRENDLLRQRIRDLERSLAAKSIGERDDAAPRRAGTSTEG